MLNLKGDVGTVVTDSHIHFLPPSLLSSSGDSSGVYATFDAGGRQTLYLRGRPLDSVVRDFTRLEIVRRECLQMGVDSLVLSPWVSMLPLDASPGAAAQACRRHNLAMAEEVGVHSGVSGLAAIPMQDPDLAIDVMVEASALGLVGAEITPSLGHRFVGDPCYEDFWGEMARRSIPVFIHPSTRGLDMAVFANNYLWNTLGNPVETAIAGCQLVLSGLLERHSGLKVMLAHGGGAIQAVFGRVEHSFRVRREVSEVLGHPPMWSFRRLFYDSITHDDGQLMTLVGTVGESQVLFGTDHPFDMGSYQGHPERIRELLGPEKAYAVLSGNAERFFGRDGDLER